MLRESTRIIQRGRVVRTLVWLSVAHGLGCSALLDLRDDYQLASDGGAVDGGRETGARDAANDQGNGDSAETRGRTCSLPPTSRLAPTQGLPKTEARATRGR